MKWSWLVAAAAVAGAGGGALLLSTKHAPIGVPGATNSPTCQRELAAAKAAFARAQEARGQVAKLKALGPAGDPARATELEAARKQDRRSQNALEAALVKGREAGCAMPATGALEAMVAADEAAAPH